MGKVAKQRGSVDDDRDTAAQFLREVNDPESWAGVQAIAAHVLDIERDALRFIATRLAPASVADVPGDWPAHVSIESLRVCVEYAVAVACGMPGGFPKIDHERKVPVDPQSTDAGVPLEHVVQGGQRTMGSSPRDQHAVCLRGAQEVAETAQNDVVPAVRTAPWPWHSTTHGDVRTGARLEEIFGALEALARAGDLASAHAAAALRELRRARLAPLRPMYRERWLEWASSLKTVRDNAVAALSASDVGGAALLLVARRLPVESQELAFDCMVALMNCRGAARDGASDDDLLSEALRQLGCSPKLYLDALTGPQRQKTRKARDDSEKAHMAASPKVKARDRRPNGRGSKPHKPK